MNNANREHELIRLFLKTIIVIGYLTEFMTSLKHTMGRWYQASDQLKASFCITI